MIAKLKRSLNIFSNGINKVNATDNINHIRVRTINFENTIVHILTGKIFPFDTGQQRLHSRLLGLLNTSIQCSLVHLVF